MAASYLLRRSVRWANAQRVLHTSGCPLYPTSFLQLRAETLSLRGSHLACRSFSAQALEVRAPNLGTRTSKKKQSSASSWEEAGNAFFSAKNGKDVSKDGESLDQSSGGSSYSCTEEATIANRNLGKRNDRAVNASGQRTFGNSRNSSRDLDWDRGEFRGGNRSDDGGFARRQSSGSENGGGAYRGRGFRDGFSAEGDDGRTNRWNARGDANDGRGLWGARSDVDSRGMYRGKSRSGSFREDSFQRRGPNQNDRMMDGYRNEFSDGYIDDRSAPRSGGAFRRQFGDSVDNSKGFFQKRNRGSVLGKKQFPDVDGGKRMFKGRFEGDGFVKKEMNRENSSGKNSYGGSLQRGQSFSRGTSRTRVQKQSEDEVEGDTFSEDEEEDEDFPQAGDVIRYSESASAKADVDDGEGGLQEDDGDEVEPDKDDATFRGRDFGSVRKELPMMGSSLPRLKGEVVYGVGPVYAALKVSRREFFCLYVQQNMPIGGGNASKKKDKKAVEWIIRSAVTRGLEVKELSKHDLNMLADNRPHQGLILDASPLELVVSTHLEEPFAKNRKTPVWVALDEVTDPQNFGAILRSAYFLGAAGVVVCAKNSAPLSAVVSKASAGALEVMELRSCKNMMKFLDRSVENGWRVVGGAAAGTDVISVRELPVGLPTILVLGGEGKGLRTNVKSCCSELVCIPGLASETGGKKASLLKSSKKFQDGADVDIEDDKWQSHLRSSGEEFVAVESLNVSVAAGILLHELLNVQGTPEGSTLTDPVLGDEKVQNSEIAVEAALSDEQEEQCETDVEVALTIALERDSGVNANADLSNGQDQHLGVVAMDSV